MATRSRKRSSVPSSDPPQVHEPLTKRLRSWKSKRSALMELPAEIRLKILTELLWQREPLKVTREAGYEWKPCADGSSDEYPSTISRESSFSLYPAVLRLCRTIYEEGVPILYNNAIGCEIWCDFDCVTSSTPYQVSFLRAVWDLGGTYVPSRAEGFTQVYVSPNALICRVKRLDVVVRVGSIDQCLSTRGAVRQFVQAAKDLPLLSEINIRLQLAADSTTGLFSDTRKYDYEPISLQEYRDFALGPFAQLRNLRQVSLTGVSKSIANELKKVMLGHEPIINLSRMYDSLMKYIQKRLQYVHCAHCRSAFRHAARAEYEVDMEDERAFRKSRSKIFAIISEHEKRDLRIALRDDPDVQVGEFGSTWIEDGDKYEAPQEHSDWKLANPIEESDEDREFKRQQEKERPSLARLREVVCKEREFS